MADELHKLIILLKRKSGMSLEAFRHHYEERHVPLGMKYMAGPTRYIRQYLDPVDGMAEPECDVITELWFPDEVMRDGVLAAMAKDAMPPDIIADEEQFLDGSKSRFHAVFEHETPIGAR